MEETIKFICKKTLKWIWIPALAAVICGIATIMFQNKSVDPKPSLKEYNMDWEVFPEAHRYAIYTIQIKPDTLKRADPNSEPLSYLNQYGELIRQRIMSISNINSIYNALIDQYGVLFPDYSSNKMLNEMIAVYTVDNSTLVVCANAPISLNQDAEGKELKDPLFSDEQLCGMRDYMSSFLIETIEEDEYFRTLPVELIRISKTAEDTLSEQSLISDRFSRDKIILKNEGPNEGISVKKLVASSGFAFIFTYAIIFLIIMGNGRVKSGEELELMTNLDVYDDFLYKDYDEAVSSIVVKLQTKNIQDDLYVVDLNTDSDQCLQVVESIKRQWKKSNGKLLDMTVLSWNKDANAEILEKLAKEKYLVYLQQNKTAKTEIKQFAKEMAQVQSPCFGAIISKQDNDRIG